MSSSLGRVGGFAFPDGQLCHRSEDEGSLRIPLSGSVSLSMNESVTERLA